MKVSWVILTYNRAETVIDSIGHNFHNAGEGIEEVIWVDNGSSVDQRNLMDSSYLCGADVKVWNRQNLGVARGYNRGIVLATGDLILITGCDRLMPKDWLKTIKNYFEKIPRTGVISIYSQPLEEVPERFKNREIIHEDYDGLPLIRALPIGAKAFRRELLKDVGHLREDFGMYGWEDVEWALRMQKNILQKDLLSYIIPGFIAEHMGCEGIREFNGKDGEDYHAFKQREANDPKKQELLKWCMEHEYPFYSPYV